MVKIYSFMQIDTCPICGDDMHPEWFEGLGDPQGPKGDEVKIKCANNCGDFVLRRETEPGRTDEWNASYVLHAEWPEA